MPDLTRDDLPMWLWGEIATPEFFARMPKNLSVPKFAEAKSEPATENEAVPGEPKKERQMFYYATIKTRCCIDDGLSFCEGLATVYSRILENRSEKIFLKGNIFLSKLAKAIFEQNQNIFAEACGKYADEKYFKECMEPARKWGFVAGEKFSKTSWLDLYEIVLLLTEEYLATKRELPKLDAFECVDNGDSPGTLEIIVAKHSTNEKELGEAAWAPLDNGLGDSSDDIKAGDLFHEFLGKNFPFKNDKDNFTEFIKEIYGEEVCGDLGWLYESLSSNSLPRTEIKVDAMEGGDMLGDHGGDTVCVNQRLVLDAISSRNPKDCFILFLAMLIEYGHFLGGVLRGKAGIQSEAPYLAGRNFAYLFMECSESLLGGSFEFADFTAPDAKGEEQKFAVKVSGLSREQMEDIFYSLGSESLWEGGA